MKLNMLKRSKKKTRCSFLFVLVVAIITIAVPGIRDTLFKHRHTYMETDLRLTENDAWMVVSHDSPEPIGRRRVKVGGVEWNLEHVGNKNDVTFASRVQEVVYKIVKRGGKFIFFTLDHHPPTSTERLKLRPVTWQLHPVGKLGNLFVGLDDSDRNMFLGLDDSDRYELKLRKTPTLQKVIQPRETILVANGKAMTSYRFPISLDKYSPQTVLSDELEILFDYNNIFLHYDAFWAIGVCHHLGSVWSTWTRRLLKEIDSPIAFMFGDGSATSNMFAKYRNEMTSNMVSDIASWECDESEDFLSCVETLSRLIMRNGYISRENHRNVVQWIHRLSQIGYKAPSRVRKSKKGASLARSHQVLFRPGNKQSNQTQPMVGECGEDLPPCPWERERSTERHPLYWSNILLVVVFNRPHHYDSVPYLDKLYRPFFANILYCGRDLPAFRRATDRLHLPVSFLEMYSDFMSGHGGYQCVQHAMHMQYDVEGYLHIGDDVLLNIWNLRGLPTNQIWFQQSMRVANLSQLTVPDVWRSAYWPIWSYYGGRVCLVNVINRLHRLRSVHDIARSFVDQLEANLNGSHQVFYEVSDIFYIPSRYKIHFSFLATIFNDGQVHLELAIPNIINGLDKQDNIVRLSGEYLWYEDRVFYCESFDVTDVFLHPVKHDTCMSDDKCVSFLCESYLPCLYDNH